MSAEEIDAMMAAVATVVREYVDAKTGPLVARVAELEARPKAEKGETGKDADPLFVVETVHKAVETAVARIPVPKDGTSVTPEDLQPMIEREARIQAAIAVAAIPQPKDGEPGKDADPADLLAAVELQVEKAVAALPIPKDGSSVTPDDVLPLIRAEVGKAVAAVPTAKDGVGLTGATIDREGHLVLTLSDGSMKDAGLVVGRDADPVEVARAVAAAVAAIPKPKDGEDGEDGLGFEDIQASYDEAGRLRIACVRGEKSSPWFLVPGFTYRGVYKSTERYERGDTITWGSSAWIAKCGSQGAQPGTEAGADAWQLAVKRGDNGKPGLKGDKGDAGKDLTVAVDPQVVRRTW
jgi:hypothetical protein